MIALDPDRMVLVSGFCRGMAQGFVAIGVLLALMVVFDEVLGWLVTALAAVIGGWRPRSRVPAARVRRSPRQPLLAPHVRPAAHVPGWWRLL
jgi:hypothetical protein